MFCHSVLLYSVIVWEMVGDKCERKNPNFSFLLLSTLPILMFFFFKY